MQLAQPSQQARPPAEAPPTPPAAPHRTTALRSQQERRQRASPWESEYPARTPALRCLAWNGRRDLRGRNRNVRVELQDFGFGPSRQYRAERSNCLRGRRRRCRTLADVWAAVWADAGKFAAGAAFPRKAALAGGGAAGAPLRPAAEFVLVSGASARGGVASTSSSRICSTSRGPSTGCRPAVGSFSITVVLVKFPRPPASALPRWSRPTTACSCA